MQERGGREPRHVHAAIERAEPLQCSPNQGRAWVQVACRWRAGGVQGLAQWWREGMGRGPALKVGHGKDPRRH